MAQNFNKIGYSTTEVAQILGMAKPTLINRINSGKIDAIVKPPVTPGGKRGIRITREALADYIFSGDWHVEDALKETFSKYRTKKVPDTSEPGEPEIIGAYKANDISELTGAWAVPKNSEQIDTQESANSGSFVHNDSCSIEIDGRIAIANIQTETARYILDAILNDPYTKFTSITVKRGGAD